MVNNKNKLKLIFTEFLQAPGKSRNVYQKYVQYSKEMKNELEKRIHNDRDSTKESNRKTS